MVALETEQRTAPLSCPQVEVHYRNGIAVRVTKYCVVNGDSLATHDYRITDRGFTEEHFDEHHSIDTSSRVIPRVRLEALETANPRNISVLRILGSDRQCVEAYVEEGKFDVKYLGK